MNVNTPRILHIITGLSTGGAERALYNLLNGGLITRFENHVVSLSDEGTIGPQILALGVPVTVLGMRSGLPSLSSLRNLYQVVREYQPDVIQGWMYHGNLMAILARSFVSGCTKLVWNVRQTLYELDYEKPMTRIVIRLNKWFSTSPGILLYNSKLSREQHESFGFSSHKGQVIPNGIDVQRFSFSSALRHSVRSELHIPAKAKVIGHVARWHPMKDHPAFLHAAVDIALKYSETHFLLSGWNVSHKNEALQLLIPKRVCSKFHFLGERDDVSNLMNAMDIFCLSSAWGEGFPNVIGEAMATGVPCVVTDVGDSAIVIGDTGVVVPPQDEEALAAGIESLLIMPLEKRRTLGANARDRIETNYRLEAIVSQYAALYEYLLKEKREG